MKVRYEPARSELSYVVQAPLLFEIEGVGCYLAERWSLEGIQLPQDAPGLGGHALITIPFQGFGITFRALLEYDAASGLLRFADIGQREAGVLRHFYRQLVSGQASSIETMILSMDVPVDLIPMNQTPAEADVAEAKAPPRVLRTACAMCVYALFAVIAYQPVVAPILDALRSDKQPAMVAGF